ncbi:AAA family ATPase [Enterococcus faecium]|nr:AAA family ATPase [Enterococcus faecium]
MKKLNLGYVMAINMFKGGVGKSTLTQLMADILSAMGFKVLVIDVDPQGTVTKKFQRQYDLDVIGRMTLFDAVINMSFKESITNIKENLDIVIGSEQMSRFTKVLRDMWRSTGFSDEGEEIFWNLFNYMINNDDLRSQYDFVLFDTIPTVSEFTDNVYVASDFLVIPTQTEQDSIDNLHSTVNNYRTAVKEVNSNLEILGIVPYLVDTRLKTGKELLTELQEEYGDMVYSNVVNDKGVVRRWGREGLDKSIPHSKKTYQMYVNIAVETLERLEKVTGENLLN